MKKKLKTLDFDLKKNAYERRKRHCFNGEQQRLLK